MPEVWEGKAYKLTESKNFDEYMKALGVGFVLRKLANSAKSTIELKKEGDQYTLVMSSTVRTFSISFKLGEEFEEQTMDGRKVKSTVTLEGDKFIHKQEGTPSSITIREFTEKELIVTMTVKDVTCIRKYTAQ
ncbi:probable fatty acid-binding protein [Sitodiplosis mosellana]|uniref:probable fatty acid-binding protein n=1 Tax=Sitodiplosis mosellana TaxID=263140 RepID=UPI0024452F21|nr:probable fatty acid-binding protein [Sitodiplosis mosellana]